MSASKTLIEFDIKNLRPNFNVLNHERDRKKQGLYSFKEASINFLQARGRCLSDQDKSPEVDSHKDLINI